MKLNSLKPFVFGLVLCLGLVFFAWLVLFVFVWGFLCCRWGLVWISPPPP